MDLYTIGFVKKSAEDFFSLIGARGIGRLVDVRLRNDSQLAGFTKKNDLGFFLREVSGADYVHEPMLAPTPEILDAYRKKAMSWAEYETAYLDLLEHRVAASKLSKSHFMGATVLLCSESTAEHCHRRLAAEYLKREWGDIEIHHL